MDALEATISLLMATAPPPSQHESMSAKERLKELRLRAVGSDAAREVESIGAEALDLWPEVMGYFDGRCFEKDRTNGRMHAARDVATIHARAGVLRYLQRSGSRAAELLRTAAGFYDRVLEFQKENPVESSGPEYYRNLCFDTSDTAVAQAVVAMGAVGRTPNVPQHGKDLVRMAAKHWLDAGPSLWRNAPVQNYLDAARSWLVRGRTYEGLQVFDRVLDQYANRIDRVDRARSFSASP